MSTADQLKRTVVWLFGVLHRVLWKETYQFSPWLYYILYILQQPSSRLGITYIIYNITRALYTIQYTMWRVKTAMATNSLSACETHTHTRKPIACSDYWRDVHAKAKPIDRGPWYVCAHIIFFTRTLHTRTRIARNYITQLYIRTYYYIYSDTKTTYKIKCCVCCVSYRFI